MTAIHVTAEPLGPLFAPGAERIVDAVTADAMRELSNDAMLRLTEAFPTGVPVVSGNYFRHLHATVNPKEVQVDDSGVIYGPWLEGTSSRNQSTRFRGYSTFRRAAQWLQDERVPVVMPSAVERIVKELGG